LFVHLLPWVAYIKINMSSVEKVGWKDSGEGDFLFCPWLPDYTGHAAMPVCCKL
jgi:hypothetical protein